jgi:hypothetical protein
VAVTLVRRADDAALIRLADTQTGELFAECPVTLPLQTCLEAVVDSSRYFVLRIVDASSGNHAFVGLGFRDRLVASDFNAAIFDYAQYLERKHAAKQMREQHEARQQQQAERPDQGQAGSTAAVPGPPPPPPFDMSLKPGEQMHLRINTGARSGKFLFGAPGGGMTKSFSLLLDPVTGKSMEAALAPPPAARGTMATPMGVSPSHADAGAANAAAEWGEFATAAPNAAAAAGAEA